MTDGDGPGPEAIERRVPRTDWFARRWRILVLGLVVVPPVVGMVLATVVREERVGPWDVGAHAFVVVSAFAVIWGVFALNRWRRRGRRRAAGTGPEAWHGHGYWSTEAEKRFVALRPSRTIAAARRFLEGSAWFAIAGGFVLAVDRSPAACTTLSVGMGSMAVVAVLGVRGYANVVLVWRERPARTGTAAHYSISVDSMPKRRYERIEMTLRCVVETPRRHGLVRPDVACAFAATRIFADELMDGSIALHARFDIPEGLPAADPEGEPAVFWELVLTAERSGSRLDETFLVPVYPPLS